MSELFKLKNYFEKSGSRAAKGEIVILRFILFTTKIFIDWRFIVTFRRFILHLESGVFAHLYTGFSNHSNSGDRARV